MSIDSYCNRRETASSRREFLAKSSFGFGSIALQSMLGAGSPADSHSSRAPHFAAKAKSVIFIFMQGGPSHIDTFDPKPALTRLDGQPLPPSFRPEELGLQFIKASEAKLMGSRRAFKRYGQSGLEVSDLFGKVGKYADDLAVIRSCYHDSFIHGPAISLIHTGSIRTGNPSMGAWMLYGLGSANENLPAYLVMADGGMRGSKSLFGAGFLPAAYQGTLVATDGAPFENLSPPEGMTTEQQRIVLDQVQAWNTRHLESRADDTELAARISSYELAFRMQMAAPELIDTGKEPKQIRDMYGLDDKPTAKFGNMCLLARRMVERGVRFVHLYNSDWDGHGECDRNHVNNARKSDLPIAGLLGDLKQRGLLDSTLVISTGEFGRTPVMQGNGGRDHNPYGFTVWMAGGGIRGGKVIGATDEIGFRAVEEKVHVHDLHATILELIGLDHKRLTFLQSGLEKRLTGVGDEGNKGIAKRLLNG